MAEMTNSVVVITGAGSGFGRATAMLLAQRGATIVAADIDLEAAQATVGLCRTQGGDGVALRVDVSQHSEMVGFAEEVESTLGVPDVVINNAGIGMAGSFLGTTAHDWERIIGINLRGVLYGSQLFAEQMVRTGRPGTIVNIASAAAFIPMAGASAYASTKAAVLSVSQAMRHELKPHGISVSTVCPGFANTNIAATTHHTGVSADEERSRQQRADKAYQRRNLSAETVAAAIVKAIDTKKAVVVVGAEAHAARRIPRVMARAIALGYRLEARAGRRSSLRR